MGRRDTYFGDCKSPYSRPADCKSAGTGKSHVEKIAPVYVYPGEDEMKALAFNGLMVLNGETDVKVYE